MKTVILVLDVDNFSNGREVVEHLENREFQTLKEIEDAATEENSGLPAFFGVYELTDFMDACNNEELNIVNIWIGYVRIPDDLKI